MEKKLPLTSYSSEGKRHFEKLFRSRKDKNEVNNNASTTLNPPLPHPPRWISRLINRRSY